MIQFPNFCSRIYSKPKAMNRKITQVFATFTYFANSTCKKNLHLFNNLLIFLTFKPLKIYTVLQNFPATTTTMSTKLFAVIVTLALATGVISAPDYGETCSSLIQCQRYSEHHDQSVICMLRPNASDPTGYCSTFAVATGKCACARNCGAFHDHHEDGEFLRDEGRCVGFVGSFYYNGYPENDCVPNAYCPGTSRRCVCTLGFETGPDGRHCVAIKK